MGKESRCGLVQDFVKVPVAAKSGIMARSLCESPLSERGQPNAVPLFLDCLGQPKDN